MHIERELKFRLPRGAAPRLPALPRSAHRVESVYYDTAAQALRRRGLALRLRRDGSRWRQTLKAEGAACGGLSARIEWEVPRERGTLDLRAFPLAEIRRRTGLDLGTLAGRLRPLFETRFRRRRSLVALEDGGSAELCIDRGHIVSGRAREAIRELELELRAGSPQSLLAFGEGLGLALAYESKAERGYRLAAGKRAAPRKWRAPPIAAAAAPAEAFAALAGAALAQVGVNAPGAAAASDPQYLHQMRVGLRRLRSLLRAFAPHVRDAGPLKRDLRRFMRTLTPARDWDVIVGRLRRSGGGVPADVRRQHAAARRAARAAARSPELTALLFRALRWIEAQPLAPEAPALARLGAASLERLYRKARRHAGAQDAAGRHALRVRLKDLRYAAEAFAPAIPGSETMIRALRRLQDLLGELNDLAVARKRMRKLGRPLPAAFDRAERRLSAAAAARWAAFERQAPNWRRSAR